MGLGTWAGFTGLPLQGLVLLSSRVNPQGNRRSAPGLESRLAGSPGHHIEHMFPSQQALDPNTCPEGSAGGLDGMTLRTGRPYSAWEGTGGHVVRKNRRILASLPRGGGGMLDQKPAWLGLPLGKLKTGNANALARQ